MRKIKVTFRSPSFALNNKIALIKDLRSYTGYCLKEAKDVVDAIFSGIGYETNIDDDDYCLSVGASEFFRFEFVSDNFGIQPLAVNKILVQLKYSLDIAIEERNFGVARKLIDAIELL
jgi:hypothetical protein